MVRFDRRFFRQDFGESDHDEPEFGESDHDEPDFDGPDVTSKIITYHNLKGQLLKDLTLTG